MLCVSNLAEHGRNLANDPRASLSIVTASSDADPLATSRITLAGVVAAPVGADRDAARAAYLAAVPAARFYIEYSDFTLWVLRVDRVRWVGGYGRMDSATGANYLAAEPDPVTPAAARRDRAPQCRSRRRAGVDGPGLRRLSRRRERSAPASTATASTCGCTPRAESPTPGSASPSRCILPINYARSQQNWRTRRLERAVAALRDSRLSHADRPWPGPTSVAAAASSQRSPAAPRGLVAAGVAFVAACRLARSFGLVHRQVRVAQDLLGATASRRAAR